MINNLEKVYELVQKKQDDINSFYDLIEGNGDAKKEEILSELFISSTLNDTKENRLALISRLVTLRDENLLQALKQENKTEKEIKKITIDVYESVKKYHLHVQKELIEDIRKQELLSEFYTVLLDGVYDVGELLSSIWIEWKKQIIFHINEKLAEKYGDKVYEYLEKNHLFEYFEDGTQADRSYSVLKEDGEGFISLAYIDAFSDMPKVVQRLEKLIDDLSILKDEDYGQEEAYVNYFLALKNAFNQKDKSKLLTSWQEVDSAWMKVTSPIQVGHPLEYYEDHLRKAVALEWDIRLDDVKRQKSTCVKDDILYMYKSLSDKLDDDGKVYEKCVANVNRVALHVGRPAFYFGAEFDGLFSAQVVPNDETISKKYGKKIFAFADNVYEASKAKPFLKIHSQVFKEEFLNESREILFHNEPLWHKVYEVSTIGHEFGHILWLKVDSEMVMNKSGMFKNIEEFKATTGGLMAFFYNEKDELKRPLMIDLIKRAVGLIGWMKTGEVEPYYCEGLIHLSGLFETKVLEFKDSLKIDMSESAYERLKTWYISTYEKLAICYLEQNDAKSFLDDYAKKEDGYFLPTDLHVKYFVNYYWNLHESIGRVVDDADRSKWV